MEKSTRELEWFDLEIRTRELIHQQLEPVLSKAREDRESVLNLKTYSAKLEKRVHELEVAVLGDKPQETVISTLFSLCATIEGQRKKDVVNFEQNVESINEKLKTVNFTLSNIHEELICVHTTEKSTEQELGKINEIFEENKQVIIEEIHKLDERFKELNAIYQDLAIKAEERSVLAINKANTNNLEMGNYKREVENIRKQQLEALTMVREVKANKFEESEFTAYSIQLESKFLKFTEEIGKFKDDLYHRDRFMDKFIPLQTATMISDYMHYALDNSQKKRLAEFESMTLQLLNNSAISSEPIDRRDVKAEKILNEMKHVEERKVKLLTDSSKDKESEVKIVKPVKAKLEEVKQVIVHGGLKDSGVNLKEVENLINEKLLLLNSSLLKTIQDEVALKQEANKNYFKAIIDQNNTLLNQVLQEYEENSKSFKRDIGQMFKEMNSLKNLAEEQKKAVKANEVSLAFLTKMVVCLVENAQIEQALEAQDEEDRQSMVNSYDKETQNDLAMNRPRATPDPYGSGLPSTLAVQKKCLGCGGNSTLLSGIKTTLMYKPTPLMYRNRKFERSLLINFRGKMVKDCWENINHFIPWKQEDMENLVSETYKSFKGEEEKVLPVLTSATRNKSYHHRKIKSFKGSM